VRVVELWVHSFILKLGAGQASGPLQDLPVSPPGKKTSRTICVSQSLGEEKKLLSTAGILMILSKNSSCFLKIVTHLVL
jgi:hypothetical protein